MHMQDFDPLAALLEGAFEDQRKAEKRREAVLGFILGDPGTKSEIAAKRKPSLLETDPAAFRAILQKAQRRRIRLYPSGKAHLWKPPPFVFIRSCVEREGEKVTVDYIWERDNRICHICKKYVDRKDASRDHLIPISAGGPHVRANIALAHRLCNVRRGVGKRVPAQLRLLG